MLFARAVNVSIKFSSTFYKKVADSKGRAFGRPSQWAESPFRRGAFLKSEFASSQWEVAKRKTFCKKKSFSAPFLMSFFSVFPQGKIRITGDGKDAKSSFPAMVPSVSPERGTETTGDGREEKQPSRKRGPAWLLMVLPSVFPQGKIRITGDGKDAKSSFPAMVPFVSPEGEIETTEDRRPLRGNQTHTGRYRNQK